AVGVDDVDLQMVLLLAVAAEDHALAVGREERAAVVAARGPGQLPHVLAVGVHDVQLEVLRPAPVGAEDDVLGVGRVRALGVVAGGGREPLQGAAVLGVGLEDVEERVEVPDVAAALAGLLLLGALAELLGVVLAGLGVEVGAGEEDLLAVGAEVG